MKSNLGSAETRIYELGLFDGSSNRVPFTALNTFADLRGNLQYGEAALIRDSELHSAGPFDRLFDENTSTYARFQLTPTKEVEEKWIYVTMRVPADVKVCSYDFSAYNNGDYKNAGLKDFALQGSLDGVNWTTIDEKTGCTAKSNAKWYSDESAVVKDGKHCGFEIDSSIPPADRNEGFASRISDVRVDGNATLSLQGDVRLSKLTVDISDAGRIVGGEVAETGSLTVIGTVNDSMALPLNVVGMKNMQNFEHWSVSVNGSVQPTVKALIRNGVLHLKYQKGFVLHVR